MMRKILSMFLVLCMVMTMLPGTALAEESGVSSEAGLNTAITTVPAGGTIILGDDINLEATVTIASSNDKSFTLDLNGKTLVSGAYSAAIVHNGSGTLTITDTAGGGGGKITCAYDVGTIELNGGSVVVTGGTVANTATTGVAIFNLGVGSVVVNGGTVQSNYASITNKSTGSVSVTGGTVECSRAFPGIAIYNEGTGSVSVSGGTVKNTDTGLVIYNSKTGKISISGNAVVTGAPTYSSYDGTIYLFGGDSSDTVLEITGGTIENTSASGKAIYNNASGKISIPSGSAIIKGGNIAMNTAPDLSGYANVQISASTTDAQGSDATVITKETLASGISTYKYLKFEQETAPGVSEQFTNIVPGGTYYFDLSSEKGNIGTANTALPDTTLHYVPFTYAGTVNAYSLTSAMATTEEYATANKSDRSLFVGDYVIGTSVSWDSLNTAKLIFGKTFDTNYTLRSLSAGSNFTGSAPYGSDHIGQPNTNEWDQILDKSGSVSNATGWIKNWNGNSTWGQDTPTSGYFLNRAYRGAHSARFWYNLNASFNNYPQLGFRPALEVLEPDTLTPDGLKAVMLNLNGGSLKGSTANINIICAGESFTAPSGEGLTAPSGKTFGGWKDTNSTTPYAVGVTVPNTVTGLIAQWAANTVDVLDLSGKLTVPVKNGTPSTAGIDTAQYTGTVAWDGTPAKFLGGTSYTAHVSLTAKPGYTFSGLGANSFSFAGASVTHAAGSGNTLSAAVTFPTTAAKELASIAVTTPPDKTGYKYGEIFDPTGMVVKATYDDGTENPAFTDYTVDKTGALTMDDTTITLTANGTSITITQTITITKADGPAVPSVSFSFDGANANKLMGATASMEYSLDGGSNYTDCDADTDLTASLDSIMAANDIQVRVKQTTTHHAGAIQTIDITQPVPPTGIGKTDEPSALNNGTITGVDSLMEYKKSGDESYTAISGNTVPGLAPDTYLVRLKAAGTALASLDATVTIAAFVKKTPTAADLVYNLTAVDYNSGTPKPVSVTAGSGKTLGAITVIYNSITNEPPINAGTYAVTVNIAGSAEYNAVTGLSLGNYTINKIAYTGTTTVSASVLVSGQIGATLTLPTLPLAASYGTPTTGGAIMMTAMSIDGTTLTYTAPPSTAEQTGTMTIPVTGATNYNDYSIIVTVTSTAKTPQVISYATAAITKTYGDAPFTNPLSQTTVNGTITYASDDTSVAMVNPTTGAVIIMAVGDGSATITATAAETDTHAQAVASYTVTVTPKALTLKADDKSITKGDGLPAFTYTATGLVNGDAVTTPPTMSTTADGTAVGSFDIIISDGVVANAASYNITYTKGILTVAERLFTVTVTNGTGSGSYAEGATVTITANDRSGYTFTGWSGADVTFADAAAKTTTFTMPAKAVTVTPNYRQNSSGGDGGGGGGSTPAPTPAADIFTFTPFQLTELLNTNQAIKIENGLQILAKPGDIPRAAGDTVVIKASEIKSTESLNTFYLAYPGQQGLRKGYTVTFSSEHNGQSIPITQLNGDITLTFQLTGEDIRGIDPSTLMVYKEGDDGNVTTLTGIYDWEKNTLSVTTAHLCNFYLMAQEGIPAQRLGGTNRYATAAAISRQGWQTAENVILASGEDFPDALVAAALAGLKDAPVLLTAKDSLSPETLLEIQRLQAKTIYILGGPGVIAQAVEDRLAQHYTTQRIAGADRYETAVKLGALIQAAQSIAPTGTEGQTVILATGLNYPDSLSIAPFAAQYNLPILFTGRDTLPEKTAQALKDWGVQKIILVGGTGVISEAVATVLQNDLKMNVTRLSGSDRYLTSLAIAKYFEAYGAASPENTGAGDPSERFTMAALATGDGYADALAGAALAGKEKMPLFLMNKSSLNTELNAYLKKLQLQKIYVYGGEAVLPDRVKKELSLTPSGN